MSRFGKNYWSCTKFADWVRGTPKAGALTAAGWKKWKREARGAHPIRFWIAEEALDEIQRVLWAIPNFIYEIKYYINNRWVTRTHALTAHPNDIPRGEWRDVGHRFLPCLFNELVEFVEVELAWWHIAWDAEARRKYSAPWWSYGWLRWRTWRCPQAGLDNLEWASALDNAEFLSEEDKDKAEPTAQALAAREIKVLYHWWKIDRPARVDPYEASGWSEYCRRKRGDDIFDAFDHEDETPEERVQVYQMLDKCREIERQQEQEDEEMMIRLIKIRQNLWT